MHMDQEETRPKTEGAGVENDAERQKLLDQFGPTGVEELTRLEDELRERQAELEGAPDDRRPAAEQLKTIAEKRLELFRAERDSAGAYKFKRFGREVQGFFEESPDRPKVIEQRENGEFALAEGEEKRQMVFVNMGELDRFNKEGGGHAAGDAALRETTKAIEQIVRDHLKDRPAESQGYEVMRYSGNEFMISLDSADQTDLASIIEKINSAEPRVPGVGEPAPLVAHGFELKEAIDVLNQLQLELGQDDKVQAGDDAARELVEVAKRLADHRLEIEKVVSRGQRIKDKLTQAGADAAQTEDFFDNYVKKTFSGTELAEFKNFQDQIKADPSGDRLDDLLDQVAETQANKRFAEGREFRKFSDEVVRSRVTARRAERQGAPARLPEGGLSSPDLKIATIPEKTRGAAFVEVRRQAMDAAAEGPDKNAAEIAKLDYQIEVARRDAGTGLLDRGMHYEKLAEAIKDGKEVSTVFVDMGFLKYFDQMGGTEVGDGALKLAASIMEEAIARAGVKGEAFRYGGDEFTLQIEGGGPQKEGELSPTDKVIAEIAKLRDEVGRVPRGAKSKEEYAPTKLVFNNGECDRKTAEEVFNDLVKVRLESNEITPEQLQDEQFVAEMKAEIMTTVADVGIETEKAVSRFQQLIKEMQDPAYTQDPQRRKQVKSLIGFSNKAIFKEKGGDVFLEEMAAATDLSPVEQEARIREFVDKRVEMAHDLQDEKRQMLDRLVDAHTKIRRLKDKLGKAKRDYGEKSAQVTNLEQRLKVVEGERQQLIEVRRALGAGAEQQP